MNHPPPGPPPPPAADAPLGRVRAAVAGGRGDLGSPAESTYAYRFDAAPTLRWRVAPPLLALTPPPLPGGRPGGRGALLPAARLAGLDGAARTGGTPLGGPPPTALWRARLSCGASMPAPALLRSKRCTSRAACERPGRTSCGGWWTSRLPYPAATTLMFTAGETWRPSPSSPTRCLRSVPASCVPRQGAAQGIGGG